MIQPSEQLIQILIVFTGIGVAILLGHYRPEWKSRKTLICWTWTIAAIDIIIMNGTLARSLSAQLFIGGALILNVINFIGDRIETIKFKDFSASLSVEESNNKNHSIRKKKKAEEQWPDGDTKERPEPTSTPPRKK